MARISARPKRRSESRSRVTPASAGAATPLTRVRSFQADSTSSFRRARSARSTYPRATSERRAHTLRSPDSTRRSRSRCASSGRPFLRASRAWYFTIHAGSRLTAFPRLPVARVIAYLPRGAGQDSVSSASRRGISYSNGPWQKHKVSRENTCQAFHSESRPTSVPGQPGSLATSATVRGTTFVENPPTPKNKAVGRKDVSSFPRPPFESDNRPWAYFWLTWSAAFSLLLLRSARISSTDLFSTEFGSNFLVRFSFSRWTAIRFLSLARSSFTWAMRVPSFWYLLWTCSILSCLIIASRSVTSLSS